MFYTFKEITEILQIDEPTALALQQSGHLPLPVFISNRAVRWLRDTFIAWVESGCKPSQPMNADAFQLLRELVAEENCIMQNGGKHAKFLRAFLDESKAETARMNEVLSRTHFEK